MTHQGDNSLVFSSKTRIFRVLSVDEAAVAPTTPVIRRGDRAGTPDASAIWLSAAMEHAVDKWAAAQPDPKPSRVEAIWRLLDRALGV